MKRSPLRVDPLDLVAVVAVVAIGSMVVRRYVTDLDRWWAPGVAALVVGVLVAAALGRLDRSAAPPATGRTLHMPSPAPAVSSEPIVAIDAPRRPPSAPRRPDPGATHVRVRRVPSVFANDHFDVVTLSLPKVGNDEHENEDAWFVTTDVRRLAVADGASSAFASRQWSRILTESFASDPGIELGSAAGRTDFVTACAAKWDEAVAGGSDWWSADARTRGSFAAFLAVEMRDDESFVAHAVGDCCLLGWERSGRLSGAFPLQSADQFDSVPSLLATTAPAEGEWKSMTARLSAGSSLVLASDAVAAWLLGDVNARMPWLLATRPTEWGERFHRLRESREMVNDDVTVVAVTQRENS